jgi:hypothetical protein
LGERILIYADTIKKVLVIIEMGGKNSKEVAEKLGA